MKHTVDHTLSRSIKTTVPSSYTSPDSVAPCQSSDGDLSLIHSMNEFVEKHGTITDDEFFRVL